MVNYYAEPRIQLPFGRPYFARVSNLSPGKQVLMKDVSWYAAGQGRWYPPKSRLLRDKFVITPETKRSLEQTVGADAAVLVADITQKQNSGDGSTGNGFHVEGCFVNEIIQHMERREEILRKWNIALGIDGHYPSLLNNRGFFQDLREVRGVGWPRDYFAEEDIHITLAIDGTVPEVFNAHEQGKRFMAHAMRAAEELAFQQKYFFRQDALSVILFGEQAHDITPHAHLPASWRVSGPRNTVKCLERCVHAAEKRKGYTHVYLVMAGVAQDNGVVDVAARMNPKHSVGSPGRKAAPLNTGLTQIIVGEDWKSSGRGVAQFLQAAQDARGDFYFLKGNCADVLGLVVNEHYERYRGNIK